MTGVKFRKVSHAEGCIRNGRFMSDDLSKWKKIRCKVREQFRVGLWAVSCADRGSGSTTREETDLVC